MVGPEAERAGLVRHTSSLFLAGAALKVPLFTVVLRKGYGLGEMAMAGGSFHEPQFTIAWPTGEFGGMGLEGYARMGFRKELEAIADPVERQARFDQGGQLVRGGQGAVDSVGAGDRWGDRSGGDAGVGADWAAGWQGLEPRWMALQMGRSPLWFSQHVGRLC